MKKADYARRDFFDAWFPELAPSAELVKWFYAQPEITAAKWARYAKSCRREMNAPDRRRILKLLLREHGAKLVAGET